MIVHAVTKVIVDALLFTQPLDKMQVGLPVLHAKRAWRIHHRPEFKGIGVREDAVVIEDRRNDLRYAALLENPLVATMGKGCQTWSQRDVITGESRTGIVPTGGVDVPIQALPCFPDVQIGGFMKQCLQVKRRIFAD